jgi:signal transduction histidine kinase
VSTIRPAPTAPGGREAELKRRQWRWSRLTSRQRLTIQLLAGITVIFTLLGVIAIPLAGRALNERLDRDLTAVAVSTAATLERLPAGDYRGLASREPLAQETYTFILVGPDGTQIPLSQRSGLSGSTISLPIAELRAQSGQPFTADDPAATDTHFRVVSSAMANGYVLVVARSADEDDAALTTIKWVLTAAYIVLLIAVGLLVWLVSRQALRPLEDVIATADDIDFDNLASRVNSTSKARDVEHLTQALNRMLTRIETSAADKHQADRRLRQFVADASHELRTPLAAVLGYAELYETGVATQPEQIDKAMRRIAIEGGRMQRLVEDLLTLARLDEGRPQHPTPVDIHQVALDAIAVAQATDQQRTYNLNQGAMAVVANVDHEAFRQVLDNLLANIRNHTPPATTATIDTRADHDRCIITVADDGPGLTPTEQAHAFDRFWRSDSSRTRPGGSGLGLAIVRELIEANGGDIRLETSAEGGLKATIHLPRT